MKRGLIVVLLVLAGAGVYVGLNWNRLMTGFMTAKVDPTAQVELKAFSGTFSPTRYETVEGKKGNESPFTLNVGMALKLNDKIISGGNETRMVLALDAKNSVELRSADFILKSLFGEGSDTFSTNVEEGEVFLRLAALAGRTVFLLDTNKNRVDVQGEAVEAYLAVTSFEGTLHVFVKSGALQVSNSKGAAQPLVLKAGMGVEVGEEGGFVPVTAEAAWVKAIAW